MHFSNSIIKGDNLTNPALGVSSKRGGGYNCNKFNGFIVFLRGRFRIW